MKINQSAIKKKSKLKMSDVIAKMDLELQQELYKQFMKYLETKEFREIILLEFNKIRIKIKQKMMMKMKEQCLVI